jgi:DNA polymerase V
MENKHLMKAYSKRKIKQRIPFEAPMLPANTTENKGIDKTIDAGFSLFDLLKNKPNEYFLVKVNGESMIGSGINDGDTLIVHSNSQPKSGEIVIASLNGNLLVKRFEMIEGKVYLIASNDQFLPIEIFPFEQFQIQGVVQHVIHQI